MNRVMLLICCVLLMVAGLGLISGDWVCHGLDAIANRQVGALFTGTALFCALLFVLD